MDKMLLFVLVLVFGIIIGGIMVWWLDFCDREKWREYERSRIASDAERARDAYLLMIEREAAIND